VSFVSGFVRSFGGDYFSGRDYFFQRVGSGQWTQFAVSLPFLPSLLLTESIDAT
jgi:hypothetical protein